MYVSMHACVHACVRACVLVCVCVSVCVFYENRRTLEWCTHVSLSVNFLSGLLFFHSCRANQTSPGGPSEGVDSQRVCLQPSSILTPPDRIAGISPSLLLFPYLFLSFLSSASFCPFLHHYPPLIPFFAAITFWVFSTYFINLVWVFNVPLISVPCLKTVNAYVKLMSRWNKWFFIRAVCHSELRVQQRFLLLHYFAKRSFLLLCFP